MAEPKEIPFEVERGPAKKVEDPLVALIARLMDTQFVIPGTNIRFGLDPIIGLIPGFGDSASAVVGTALIIQSSRYGVPKIVLARMCLNLVINWAMGCIPGLGDLGSVWFKSNARNYELFRRHAGHRKQSTTGDWLFVCGLIAGVLLLMVGSFVLFLQILSMIAGAIRG